MDDGHGTGYEDLPPEVRLEILRLAIGPVITPSRSNKESNKADWAISNIMLIALTTVG